jgi:hypothetical protein
MKERSLITPLFFFNQLNNFMYQVLLIFTVYTIYMVVGTYLIEYFRNQNKSKNNLNVNV